jgi:hypothetical protein
MTEIPSSTYDGSQIPVTGRRPGRWPAILLGLSIFVFGMILGAGGALILEKKIILHSLRHPEEFPGRMTEHMKEKFGLSDLQSSRILPILTERQRRLQELQKEVQPRFEAEFEAVQKEISAVLDPEQTQRYNAWFDQVRKTWTPPIRTAREPPPD